MKQTLLIIDAQQELIEGKRKNKESLKKKKSLLTLILSLKKR
ncbi:UNVERIFIED_ORG: hypothetical protein QFZ59_000966 [Bacillus sp. B2I3]|nr:hypothetical protein [Bacillus sp. B2I3]